MKSSPYWQAQLAIFSALTFAPITVMFISASHDNKILEAMPLWITVQFLLFSSLHWLARPIIVRSSLNAKNKLLSVLIAISSSGVAIYFSLWILDKAQFLDNSNYTAQTISTVLIASVWCIGYQIVLSLRERKRLEEQYKRQSLQLFRQQIKPDFLYDSLDKIEDLIDNEEDLAAGAITQLAEVLRFTLKASKNTHTIVLEELEALKILVKLKSLPIQITIVTSDSSPKISLPGMMLFNLMEEFANKHIRVEATLSDEQCELTISQLDDLNSKLIKNSMAGTFKKYSDKFSFKYEFNSQLEKPHQLGIKLTTLN